MLTRRGRREHGVSYIPKCIPVFHHSHDLSDFDIQFFQIGGYLLDDVFEVAVVVVAVAVGGHLLSVRLEQRPVCGTLVAVVVVDAVVAVPDQVPPRDGCPVGRGRAGLCPGVVRRRLALGRFVPGACRRAVGRLYEPGEFLDLLHHGPGLIHVRGIVLARFGQPVQQPPVLSRRSHLVGVLAVPFRLVVRERQQRLGRHRPRPAAGRRQRGRQREHRQTLKHVLLARAS